MTTWLRIRVLLLAAPLLGSGGCALRSEARDKQGQELKASWAKVDSTALVTGHRKNVAALVEEQLKTEGELWQFYRTSLANDAVQRWSILEFRERLAVRGSEISGNQDFVADVDAVALAQSKLEGAKQNFKLAGVAWPGCGATRPGDARDKFLASLSKLPTQKAEAARASLGLAVQDCKDLEAAETRLEMVQGGELSQATQQLAEEERAEKQAKEELDAAVAEVKSANAEYEAASKALAGDPKSAAERVDNAKTRLINAVKKLSSLQTAVGQEFVSSTRLNGLNEFLETYDNVRVGKGAAEGSNRLAIALALFPDIRDQVEKANKDAQKPLLLPVLMIKKLEQTRLDAAQRNVARRQQIIALRKAQLDLLGQQARWIAAAKRAVDAQVKSKAVQDADLLGLWLVPLKASPFDIAGTDEKSRSERAQAQSALLVKQELWRAVALYLYSEGQLRGDVSKMYYQISALAYEEPISYAESALLQWKALLDPSVELLVEYGASGLKLKDVQDFLNTLSLLYIAAEVKR